MSKQSRYSANIESRDFPDFGKLPPRFVSNIEVAADGCWLWKGRLHDPHRYAMYGKGNRWGSPFAHRIAYMRLVGPIPEGKELDHLCRVRHCVNPAHLEPVTHYVNAHRAPFANVSECKWGHAFTEENTAIRVRADGSTYRQCRTCLARRWREQAARNAAS